MNKTFKLSQQRRALLLATGLALAVPFAHAQANEDIVIGGSIPMTGVS